MADRRLNVNPDDIQAHVDQGDGNGNDQNDQIDQNNDLNVQNDSQAGHVNILAGAPGAAQMTFASRTIQDS
jgi:hypothetical protein